MRVVSFGGGTNTTGLIIGLHERGESYDVAVFADTGSEKPHTYQHISEVSEWCVTHGHPPITTIHGSQPQQIADGSLHAECLRLGTLPSKTFGSSSCSQKWKMEPQYRFVNLLRGGRDVEWLIGFDADEERRAARAACQDWETKRFPLIEWGWTREDCVDAIARAGITQPGKSACFMCPSSKKHEVLALARDYPEQMAIALEMERRAVAGEGKAQPARVPGLGRGWSWAELIASDQQQQELFSDTCQPEGDCMCIDG